MGVCRTSKGPENFGTMKSCLFLIGEWLAAGYSANIPHHDQISWSDGVQARMCIVAKPDLTGCSVIMAAVERFQIGVVSR